MDPAKNQVLNEDNMSSIGNTLEDLNDAAQDSAKELKRKVKNEFSRVRDASSETLSNVRERAGAIGREAFHKADGMVHENPWRYIGTLAGAAAIFGFVVGRRSKRASLL